MKTQKVINQLKPPSPHQMIHNMRLGISDRATLEYKSGEQKWKNKQVICCSKRSYRPIRTIVMWWKYCKHLLPLPEKLKGSQPKSRSVLHRGYIGPRRSARVFPKILCFVNIYQDLTLEVVSHGRTLRRILLRAGINETGATRRRDPTRKRICDLFRILIWRLLTAVTPQPRLCQIKARHLFLHVVFIKLEQRKKTKKKPSQTALVLELWDVNSREQVDMHIHTHTCTLFQNIASNLWLFRGTQLKQKKKKKKKKRYFQ